MTSHIMYMVVGEPKFTTLKKVHQASFNVWENEDDFQKYCKANNLDWFTIDDFCDLINGCLDEISSINFKNIYVSQCYIKY